MNPKRRSSGWRRVSLLARLTVLAVAAAGVYACTERPKEVTAPKQMPAFEVGPGGGWDLNQNNTPTPTSPYTLTVTSSGGYAGLWIFPTPYKVGTGLINPFLAVQNSPSERGFNTDAGTPYDDTRPNFTNALPLNYVPVIRHGAGFYREFILDTNEDNSDGNWKIAVDTFDVWLCNDANAPTWTTFSQFESNSSCKKVYDLGGQIGYATDALTSGSGKTLDYDILIPEQAFMDAFSDAATRCAYAGMSATPCGYYVVVKTTMGSPPGPSGWETDATFEEFSTINRPYVSVSKVAHTSYNRTLNWEITKSADPTSLVLFAGESDSSYYSVKVDTTGHTDSDILVTDTVTISNSSGSDAPIQTFTDLMGPITVDATCTVGGSPISFPYTLANKSTIICTSSAAPPDLTAREDTATVTLADSVGGSMFQATAPVVFGAPTTITNDSVKVVDTFVGLLGIRTLGYSTGDTTFHFYDKYTCNQDDGSHKDIASILDTGQQDSATVNVACANLAVTKTANTALTRTWHWTINKSATPDKWDLFTGDSATSAYKVVVDRTDSADSNWMVSGNITVKNPGDVDITLDSLVDYIDTPTPTKATVDCSSTTYPNIAAGDSIKCSYSASLSNGTNRTNTATAWVGTHSFPGTASVDFSAATVTEVNDSVHVTDNVQGALGTAMGDTTFTYDRQFGCDGDKGANNNTATITETGQNSSATVTVNCYKLAVTKTANDSLTRRWTWNIDKQVDATKFAPGTYDVSTSTATVQSTQNLTVYYNVTVDTTGSTASDYKAFGTITVKNLNPSRAATVNSLADVVTSAINATVDCGTTTFPATIAAQDSLKCTYTVALPDGSARTNTATATQQNYNYASDGSATESGTTAYDGTASIDFSTAMVKKVDDCVNLWDIFAHGNGGAQIDSTDLNGGSQYCINNALPNTFVVTKDFGPNTPNPLVCGDNYFDNTGWLRTDDTGATDESTASIDIHVNCSVGCTLTQGYWKTHNVTFDNSVRGKGPAPDPTWGKLDAPVKVGGVWQDGDGVYQSENEPFFLSGQTWYEVFQTKPKGNAYYNLAVQYMAAVLNGLAGADQSAVASTLADAKTLFETYTPHDIAKMKGSDPIRQQFLNDAGILDQYNNGLIGPGHCTDNTST